MPPIFLSPRVARGNLLFPARVSLESDVVVYESRRWFLVTREIVAYTQIAAVRVTTGLVLGRVTVERTGSQSFGITLFVGNCRQLADEIRSRLP